MYRLTLTTRAGSIRSQTFAIHHAVTERTARIAAEQLWRDQSCMATVTLYEDNHEIDNFIGHWAGDIR
jgi:hypothetical protein